MSALRIYLADLTHVGNGVATESFPLNIGLIASYALKRYGRDIDVRLFKYPADLLTALRTAPPQILGCSNYNWNTNLSSHFCRIAKSIDPRIVTVFGGTNYPFDAANQTRFLAARPEVEAHVFYEGEEAFVRLLERALGSPRDEIWKTPIDGVQFIDRDSGSLVCGAPVARSRALDEIPSPYTTGLLDGFFDGQLSVLVETARGCPFACNFCNAGHAYFNRMSLFSDDYVREELTYIAKRAAAAGIGHATLADNNFGMIPRDATTADLLYRLREEYGWPRSLTAWTGKNSRERVIEVTRRMGDMLSISMSVQSMNEPVLLKIERGNIKLDHYRAIAQELSAQGRPQHAEVILPLPGETLATHIHGLNELLDTDVSRVFSHTLQMLHGTPYKDDDAYVREHAFVRKFRVVPLDFSRVEAASIFDVEEVAVASSTLTFSEYVQARVYSLVIDLCANSGVFEPLRKYLRGLGIRRSVWIDAVAQAVPSFDPVSREVIDSFERETQSELWDTEDELVQFYSRPENYEKLVNYEAGGNVLFKHRIWMLSQASVSWVGTVFRVSRTLIEGRDDGVPAGVTRELAALEAYVECLVTDCLSFAGIERIIEEKFPYDIPAWLRAGDDEPLSAFGSPVQLMFRLNDASAAVTRDGLKRYSTTLPGLVKLAQRVPSLRFTRDVEYGDRAVPSEAELTSGGRGDGPGRSST